MKQSTHTPNLDTTIEEIHKIRKRISESFGGNIQAMIKDTQMRQEESGHPIVSYAQSSNQNK